MTNIFVISKKKSAAFCFTLSVSFKELSTRMKLTKHCRRCYGKKVMVTIILLILSFKHLILNDIFLQINFMLITMHILTKCHSSFAIIPKKYRWLKKFPLVPKAVLDCVPW